MKRRKFRKKLVWTIVLIVFVALGFWINSRWHAWFHNPEELAYVMPAEPCNVLLTFGDQDEQSRNVSWQCDSIVKPAWIELACLTDSGDTVRIDAPGELFRSRCGVAAYYVARLRSLRPNSSYAYRAVTDGKASEWYHFRTYESRRNQLSFLYVGDVQDTLCGESNRFLCEALSRHPESEFLVCGGDMTERPTYQDWEETFRGLDSIGQAMPFLCVTGNHDYLKSVIRRLERRFPLIYSYFLDSKVDDNQVYTLNYGSVQFFLLDSNREPNYLYTQRCWLEEQLQKCTARWKIVVLHHPLYSIKGSMNNLTQRWAFNDLIEDYGVDLVLQGHEHAYARMTRHDDDGRAVTPVYTVSHCSPKNYRIDFDDRFDKFGISSRYYQTVSISADTLTMATYEAYGHTLYDSLRIVKGDRVQVEDLGRLIPEYMEYTPDPDSRKDRAFAERIADYKARHPERMKK